MESNSGNRLEKFDPATAEVIASVTASDHQDVEQAVAAARLAFPSWSRTPTAERARLLLALASKIEQHQESLAVAETRDTGKPIRLSRSVDIPRAAANFRFFATAILHAHSEAYRTDNQALNYTLRQPRGVAGLISPWNLPLYLLSWKIAPALATGNTVVAKPSELTPTTATLLAELAHEVGIPAGVLNVVHGQGAAAGAALVAHPQVPTISFTGGTVTGAAIAQAAAPLFKKLTLELGGKNPTILFADANLEEAVAGSLRAAFENQGEICLCGSRIFVERAIYQRFLDRFVAATLRLKLGDPLDENTQQGALISAQHRERVEQYIELAKSEGGALLCGGQRPTLEGRCRNGYFLQPTIVTALPIRCRVNLEEIFGPVVTISPFDTEQEVIEAANATPFGLSASIWTNHLGRAHRVAEQLECGTVWVNCWLLRDLRVPFGGIKSSGVGKEGGDEALRFFTEAKTVCVSYPSVDEKPT